VPHNLISAQENPVPFPKFQMAPRLKVLMSIGTEKEPIYNILFSQKSLKANPFQVPQRGPYEERFPNQEPFLIYLPGFLVKEPSPEALRIELLQRETLHS
jgi:hypothetical protein